jgi:uncharacterized protein (TIGR03000 family)
MKSHHSARTIVPALALLLLAVPPASAQVYFGGVKITVGPPTNPNTISTGGGHYPGGAGAIVPGYGYWPDYGYNWPTFREGLALRRSGCARPAPIEPAPAAVPVVPAATALVRVRVPADAELFIAEGATAQRGEWREFVTPPLEGGRNLQYELRARWRTNGREVERRKFVDVHPGDRVTVDFLGD